VAPILLRVRLATKNYFKNLIPSDAAAGFEVFFLRMAVDRHRFAASSADNLGSLQNYVN